jgi:ribose transport system ATP-binding protein
MNARASELLAQLGERIDPNTPADSLSVAQQQIVEIAKAMSRRVRILAMDEPTAPLTRQEITNLFTVIRQLASEGVGIIYISHRLEEVFEIGTRVTVLRDGKAVATHSVNEIDRPHLIRLMVGRELENEYPDTQLHQGKEILRLEHIHSNRLHDISLTLHHGEIVGLAGLVGAGRTELARVVFGADRKTGGRILLDGNEMRSLPASDS